MTEDSRATGPSLKAFFEASGIAVIGAGNDLSTSGSRVVRHLLDYGYGGPVYPVNPKYETVQGITCYPAISDVPDPVDLAVICVSAVRVPRLLADCGARGLQAAVIHSDGFGAAGDELAGLLRQSWTSSGLRILGPNTNGFRATADKIFADASSGLGLGALEPGPVAIIAQSGGLGGYLGPISLKRRALGCKYSIDTGNELDIDAAEALSYFADEEDLAAIGLVLESCRDGRRLVAATRKAAARDKAVIVLKLATNEVSSKAAASHTDAIAGSFHIFRDALVDAGAMVCDSSRQFVDAVALCGKRQAPRSGGIGVVTPSGGFAVLASDLCDKFGLTLPEPVTEVPAALRDTLPLATFSNPLDLSNLQGKEADVLPASIQYLMGQPGIGCVVVWHPHGFINDDKRDILVGALARAGQRATCPIYLCGAVDPGTRERLFADHGILSFDFPDDLFSVLGLLVGDGPRYAASSRPGSPAQGNQAARSGAVVGAAGRTVLQRAAGIEVVAQRTVGSAAEAARFSAALGRPVMLKVQDARYVHKSDSGLVAGPVEGTAIEEAYRQLAGRRDALGGEAEVTAETFERGVEIAIGALTDESFGRVLMVGAGGRLVELLRDVSFAPAPVDPPTALRMLRKLAVYPLLTGFRGAAEADIDALVKAMVGLSELVCEDGFEYSEADINPVIVRPAGQGAVVVDWAFIR